MNLNEPLTRWGPLLLFVAVTLVYVPSYRNQFIYDDHKIVESHPGAHSAGDIAQIFQEPHFPRFPYYRPVTRTTLLLQKAWHGNKPAPFHLFNAALMGLTAVAAFWLLRRPVFTISTPWALVGAAAFTVHPVASGCVYPICSGRETLLPATVMIAAMAAYLSAGRLGFAAAVLLGLVGFFCKEQMIILPALLLLADFLGMTGKHKLFALFGRAVVWLPLVALYLWVRHHLFGGTEYEVTDQLWLPLMSFVYAIQVILAPFVPLVYEPTLSVWPAVPRLILAAVLLGGCLYATKKAGIRGRVLWFWGAWFVILQLPTANILRQEAPYAERYVFLASMPLFAVTVAALSRLLASSALRRTLLIGGWVSVAALATISVLRGPSFLDDAAFARQWLASNPDAYEAHYTLAKYYADQNQDADARHHASEALRVKDDFADAHVHLGNLLLKAGDLKPASQHLEKARQLRPGDANTYLSLAKARSAQGQANEAEQLLLQALKLQQPYPEAHNDLGVLYGKRGQLDRAVTEFEQALQQQPEYEEPLHNLQTALRRADQLQKAQVAQRIRALLRQFGG